MKNLILLAVVVICLLHHNSFGQTATSSIDLVKQGVVLNDAGKFDEAIDKYKQALAVDPNNWQADYEMGYTLYNTGHGKDAIPYLQKILTSNASKYEVDDLLGSIYDDINEPQKAVECYKNGITNNPNFEHLHFNLGISYYRQNKYAESEECEKDAIKLDQRHASSQRAYAMATYAEQKHICSLMAWCSFLLLEPNSARSAEAYHNIRKILNYGINQQDAKHTNVSISEKEIGTSTLSVQMAVIAATEGKTNLSGVDSLNLQLTALFKQAIEFKEAQSDPFFNNYYAKFFNKLAESVNMEAFTRFISLSGYKDENLAWFKANNEKLNNLDAWIRANPRTFN